MNPMMSNSEYEKLIRAAHEEWHQNPKNTLLIDFVVGFIIYNECVKFMKVFKCRK